jgi:hypothetical protein
VLAVYRLWRILPPLGTLLRSALVCGLAYTLSLLWPTGGLLLLVKLPSIGIAILLGFFLLGEFRASEIKLLRSLFLWRTVPEQNIGGV